MNLKAILMHLGNGLVSRGYHPAEEIMLRRLRAVHRGYKRNGPYGEGELGPDRLAGLEVIVLLTEWLNASPDAQECLADLGVEWPVVAPHEPRDL